MTTAEKITLGVAIAGALGVGALLQAWVAHLLQGRERKLSIAEKSVQLADALITRMEAEMTRVQGALAEARRESEELRTQLAKTRSAGDQLAAIVEMDRTLRKSASQLTTAAELLGQMQGQVREVQAAGGLQRSVTNLLAGRPEYAHIAEAFLAEIPRQRPDKADGPEGPDPLLQR